MTWPTFVILGAPRAGTTALYAAVRQHPQIVMSRVKEPNFFAYGELDSLVFQGPAATIMAERVVRTAADYQALFAAPATVAVGRPLAIGEASMTNFLPRACERIHHYLPQAKLIAILRHPAERAYSQFINARRMGWEPLGDFGAALDAEEERLRQSWIPYLCYTYRGYYAARLAPYFAAFPPGQIRIYRYEWWQQRPQALLQDLFAFLGVDATFAPTVDPRLNAGQLPRYGWVQWLVRRVARGTIGRQRWIPQEWRRRVTQQIRQQVPPPPLLLAIRQRLTAMYRADIIELQALLQQDFSDWLS